MRLLLIRHGEAKRDGRPDHGLTSKGRKQAHSVARALDEAGDLGASAALFCSPLPRARQTAEAIAGRTDLEIQTEPDLCEMGDTTSVGESEEFGAFLVRVDRALARLANDFAEETVIVVTHAGFIVGSVLTRFEVPRGSTRARLDPVNASVTEWRLESSVWALASYNSLPGVSHISQWPDRNRA